MSEGSWVGLDVHARSVVAGVIDQGSREVRSLRVPSAFGETVAWLQTLSAPVRVVYEAGPTGYRLARACAEARIDCVVAAPSRVRAAADRVKTDRRDAERLARLLRLGEITPVRIPTLEEEAARDLVRAREDARSDLMRARHRLSKLLLRHGLVYEATAWTRTHDAWLAGSGSRVGRSHVRRLLIEAAWHQRSPSRRSVTLERRRTGKPLAVQAQAERSARRLHERWHALETRGKPRSIVVVAVARELAGHCWALATME